MKNISDNVAFFITGTLYEMNFISLETINNTCFLYERINIDTNKTTSYYNITKSESTNWNLEFTL